MAKFHHSPTCFELTSYSSSEIELMKDWIEHNCRGKVKHFHEREFQGSTKSPSTRYRKAVTRAQEEAYNFNILSGAYSRVSHYGVRPVVADLPPRPEPVHIVRFHTKDDAMMFRLVFNPPKIIWKLGKITR